MGKKQQPGYFSWRGMIERCLYPSHPAYGWYGARGVSVCERWRNSFETFMQDMGPRPDGYSIDRVDGKRGYTPDNCQWASKREQSANRCATKLTPQLAEEIKRLAATLSTKELSARYGVNIRHIRKIVTGRRWNPNGTRRKDL